MPKLATVGERNDRRAQKKAQTREHVRAVARRLFAERGYDAVTIADIARCADVAVQTVFNHFPTKEELFFDGRTAWVTGPADAVRSRAAGETPLGALKQYLGGYVRHRIAAQHDTELRSYVRTIEASPALRAHERELVFESERRLAEALLETWSDTEAAGEPTPQDPSTAAALTAAMWLNAVRALVVRHRPLVTTDAQAAELAGHLGRLADRLMDGLMDTAGRWQVDGGADQTATPTPTGRTNGANTSSTTRWTCSVESGSPTR